MTVMSVMAKEVIMDLAAIIHRSNCEFDYALDNERVVITIKTGKDAEKVSLIHGDPFIHELKRLPEWCGEKSEMQIYMELDRYYLWRIVLKPKYKRIQYCFEVSVGDETYIVFESKIVRPEEAGETSKQYFKFPWLNPSDVIAPPEWVRDTIWYQIMPDRFSLSSDFKNDGRFKKWADMTSPHWSDLYGGSLKGITERLPYLKKLGIGGIYMTPIFRSPSNHKYDTIDYTCIDPDFGTEDDMKELVRCAHEHGIRIMVDAVFNHSGYDFFAWKDVREKKKDSPYYDWFFINKDEMSDWDFKRENFSTEDARFYSFSFWSGMPKLNTNNPQVRKYFTDLSCYWAREWDIDGIRFDVGDEISHTFLRELHSSLKAVKPDIFLLGEIWNDSLGWVTSREYDSVMNYPFCGCVNDFFGNEKLDTVQLMYMFNYCRSIYPEQVTRVLFNFLDTHDTQRAVDRCKNENVLLQKLTFLLTMPGTPCIYYATEIAMHGKETMYNRQCMPWGDISNGKYDGIISEVTSLTGIRNTFRELSEEGIDYIINENYPRLLGYIRAGRICVYLNAGDIPADVEAKGSIIYSNLYDEGVLQPDGIVISDLSNE